MTNNEKIKRGNNLHNIVGCYYSAERYRKHGTWKNSATSGPSVTHEERKAHVKSALERQIPPADYECCDDTIVELPKKHFIEEELDTFEKWLKEAEPWSLEKTHLMTIVAEIACTEKLPLKYRTRASALIKSNVDEPIVATVLK